VYVHVRAWTADCIMIAHFPIENHSEQGQFEEPPDNNGKSKIWATMIQFAAFAR
jgi:hypothetical protein